MCKRDIVVFTSGAAFFHTISHIVLPHYVKLPLHMEYMTLTAQANLYVILASAAVTVLLLIWAKKLK